ncbi:unnamed protein product [Caenorhabditis bovis]|uniref:Uncharacterized protein n=1 Tax=Caenorhabditis bovis TaxID=2654633 RepID=A0A8S1E712_9PELO|nr:unnamed protein product [Caenorhabditis bovis]
MPCPLEDLSIAASRLRLSDAEAAIARDLCKTQRNADRPPPQDPNKYKRLSIVVLRFIARCSTVFKLLGLQATMFERVLSVFIFVLYLFDTVFAPSESHNKGKGETLQIDCLMNKKKIQEIKDRGVRIERFAVPS